MIAEKIFRAKVGVAKAEKGIDRAKMQVVAAEKMLCNVVILPGAGETESGNLSGLQSFQTDMVVGENLHIRNHGI